MIFVHIAAYRDPECQPTIADLLRKARWPKEIRIAVLLQVEPADQLSFAGDARCIVDVRPAHQSQGACWARAEAYRYFNDEAYVLQIDSHMRFAPDWDYILLQELAACPSPKALLTAYPPGYEPPHRLLGHQPTFLAAKAFDGDQRLVQQALIFHPADAPKPRRSALLAGGFVFGPGAWVRDVPYDPSLYFLGEESALAARLYTHGWDLYGPSRVVIWHYYHKHVRPRHWDDHANWSMRDRLALARYRHLMGINATTDPVALHDLARYGFGTARSFAAYQAFAGIDYRAQTLAPFATSGTWT